MIQNRADVIALVTQWRQDCVRNMAGSLANRCTQQVFQPTAQIADSIKTDLGYLPVHFQRAFEEALSSSAGGQDWYAGGCALRALCE